MTGTVYTDSAITHMRPTTHVLTAANRWDHFLARWGVRRDDRKLEPGLYALGKPTSSSPVFVTANYRLSFDALRSALPGTDAYLLVLNTFGVNVWCAAGKGTFGTAELIRQIEASGLRDIVEHRVLILPQLGAAGVAAHEVTKSTGFKVEYGPVRAADLPDYLKTRRATEEMRQVRFTLRDRLVLIPVELVHVIVPTLAAAIVLFFLAGPLAFIGVLAAVLAGTVLFPLLLPWVPTHDFTSKGFLLGVLVTVPVALAAFLSVPSGTVWWQRAGWAVACFLIMPSVAAYLSLNFTGSTTFTSVSGVRREIHAYVPVLAGLTCLGIVITVILWLV